ncbi:MAG TPA: XRE family transcriptional regulator [Streptosporangiaceae bacterium]|nr:XRE family transcriptional regulator [Streptosporangiaceae bacterium]
MAEVAGAFDPATELGPRLRQVREERGLSARELARRINCSPSLVSQIERGVSAPSVGMLYALASELRASLDFLFGVGPSDGLTVTAHGDGRTRPAPPAASAGDDGPAEHRPAEHRPAEHRSAERWPAGHGIVQRAGSRRTIDLASGVRWERLTPGADDRVDFLEVVYEPRGHSTDARRALRHDGYEYGLIMSGTLQARVGFESYELGAGDSIAFDSSIPHEYWNTTADEVRAVWAVVHAHPGRP